MKYLKQYSIMRTMYIDGKQVKKGYYFDKPLFYVQGVKYNIIASEITGSAPDAVTHTVKSDKGVFRIPMTKLIRDFQAGKLSDTKNINQ